jgi:hypothetical protein
LSDLAISGTAGSDRLPACFSRLFLLLGGRFAEKIHVEIHGRGCGSGASGGVLTVLLLAFQCGRDERTEVLAWYSELCLGIELSIVWCYCWGAQGREVHLQAVSNIIISAKFAYLCDMSCVSHADSEFKMVYTEIVDVAHEIM